MQGGNVAPDKQEPAPRSYSQLTTYLACPRQYQLEKVARVPRRPGWYFAAGTAIHATVERYLRLSLGVSK